MSPIDFYFPALQSDASVNALVFNQFTDASLVYDFAIVTKVLLSDLSGMQYFINNDQFNAADPSLNDIKVTLKSDFFEGVFWNLFTDQSFNYDNGNVYPIQQYVKNILNANANNSYIVENWQELSVASLIDKTYGSYKYTVLFQNEDAIVASIPTQFNTALNNTLDYIDTNSFDASNNYLIEGLGPQPANRKVFESMSTILQKALILDPSRFNNALNDLYSLRDFNSDIIQVNDTIQFLVNLYPSPSQNLQVVSGASFSNTPVVVKVVLKVVASNSDMITKSVRTYNN
jgi:hypothetical protein